MKKRCVILFLIMFLLTGCTIVRIDTASIDNIVDIVLSKNNKLYNHMSIGCKYYIPRGVSYIDSDEANDRLYSNGVYYYLYLDKIEYYYKKSLKYKKDDSKYYSKKIKNGDLVGYLEITENNSNEYLVEFVYNYAKIEAVTTKENMTDVILNSSYILSTIKYNKDTIKYIISDESSSEKKYEEFISKKETDSFLGYEEK